MARIVELENAVPQRLPTPKQSGVVGALLNHRLMVVNPAGSGKLVAGVVWLRVIIRRMFRFSLSNLMLMMLPLAAAFACIGYAAMRDSLFAYAVAAPISLVLAVPSAIGALRRGWYGMGVGFAVGWVLFTVLTLLFGVFAGTIRF